MAEEAANKPDDDCTFTPNLYTTVKKADGQKPRDINKFLSDLERYQESKNLKQEQAMMRMQSEQLMQIKTQPQIDELSKQIVEMMDERKLEPAHSRLYKKGKEKIRTQTMLAIQQNTKSMNNLNVDRIIKEDLKEE